MNRHESTATKDGGKHKTKRLCKFQSDWLKLQDFQSWLRNAQDDAMSAFCSVCKLNFSVKFEGVPMVKKHASSKKHIQLVNAMNDSARLTKFFTKPNTTDEDEAIISEIALTYHGVMHTHSYMSQDSGIKLVKKLFSDSNKSQRIHCGRTKAEAIVENVLVPYAIKNILSDVGGGPISIATDASNKGNKNLFPVAIRYFSIKKGPTTFLIDFYEDNDETSEAISAKLIESLEKSGMVRNNKLIAYGADNASINYGEFKSVFQHLKRILNFPNLIAGHCHAHILHNTAKQALKTLTFNVESFVIEVFSEFSSSAKNLAELKVFFNFMETDYIQLLGHSRIRFLTLFPAVDRILQSWPVLKAYFLRKGEENVSKLMWQFVACDQDSEVQQDQNQLSEAYLSSTSTNETTMALPWTNDNIQQFCIRAANDFGVTREGNILRVYRGGSHRYELNENNIAKVYHNGSYTLSWSPPESVSELINYTVFWCLPKIELPNQCKGPISYKYLNKLSNIFTTEPKDRSLNLAVSANYLSYNKGMQWARCSGDVSSELMKTELEINVLNESAVLLKWSSGSVCTSILKGYNLTYCQASDNDQCLEPEHNIVLLRDYRNLTINNLHPYRKVCVSMFMFSPSKRGVDSGLCTRTKQSAPSFPKHLSLQPDSITSESATISWQPPDVFNGILSHYTVYWQQQQLDIIFRMFIDVPINQTSYTLKNLNCSTSYLVYVSASTIKESGPSELVKLTTLVSFPSSPRNIQIDENDKFISWDKPDIPSARQVFYIVALLRRHGENESIYDRVSIVKSLSCRFQLPDCTNPKESFALEVRAVDVANVNETDVNVKSMRQDELFAGAPIIQSFCEEEDESYWHEEIFFDDGNKKFLASSWEQARKYFCFSGSKTSIYAVAFVIAVAFSVYICYWIRKKYYKMKNIKVILPEGLVDQVANYKFGGSSLGSSCNLESTVKKEFHSDISRSSDCLVSNQNPFEKLHKFSDNALSSLSSNNISSDHCNDGQVSEHPSLETTNEELSSNSSSNSNLTYLNRHHMEKLSSTECTVMYSSPAGDKMTLLKHEDDAEAAPARTYLNSQGYIGDDEIQNLQASNLDEGYVTHNTQLLASLFQSSEGSTASTPNFSILPAMTNDGYMQPSAAKQVHQFPIQATSDVTALNGYTSVDTLNQQSTSEHNASLFPAHTSLTSPTSPTSAISPASSTSRHTQPDVSMTNSPCSITTDMQETDHTKDVKLIMSSSSTNTSSNPQPSNNNNAIHGYVTQQQLASFGTNFALGKELNT